MLRIGLSGVPGAGKTYLAKELSSLVPNSEYVDEYARQFIEEKGTPQNKEDQLFILNKQISKEERCSAPILITDSPVHLNLIYTLEVDKDFIKTYHIIKEYSYDIIFHLPPPSELEEVGIKKQKHLDPKYLRYLDYKILKLWKIFPPVKLIKIERNNLQKCLDEVQISS